MSVSECSRFYYNVSRGLIYLRIKDPNTFKKFKED